MSNLSITRTVPHGVTTPLPGLEHPSFPGRTIPAVLDGHTPPTWCVYCDQLAGQIRACERLGDWDGMVAYGWQAIRHWFVIHEKTPAVRERRGGVAPTIAPGGPR